MRASTLLRAVLCIQHLVVRGFHFDEEGLVVKVSMRWKIPRCGECGVPARSVHDQRERSWRHLDLAGMVVRFQSTIRRVRCAGCGGVKTERVPWAAHGSGFTYSFEERIAYLAQQSSKTAVSQLMRVTWRTVGRVIQRVVGRHLGEMPDRLEGLRHIGIDELSYRRHHQYITVVVDHGRATTVWSSRGKNAATLRAFFEDLGPARRAMIESVTIDMSQAYISVVKEMVPHARLIFDRFHVQRLVQDALDETRRDEVRAAVSKADKKVLKGTRWPLLKSPWNLTGSDLQTLEELEEANRPLFRGHLLKETLVAILDGRQINVARDRMDQWITDARRSRLPHFVRIAGTMQKHREGILEYVRTRFTNARVEGLNGKIRTITRRAFGFHSASALIALIFLCCGGVHVTPAFSTPSGFHD